jgi:hypothetical protein
MQRTVVVFGIATLMLAGCSDQQPTQPGSDVAGVWTGQIDSHPMRMEITSDNGVTMGNLLWEAGDPVHGARITKWVFTGGDSFFLDLAGAGTGTTVVTMRGRQTGNLMEGRFTQLLPDMGLSEEGTWRAEREPRTPPIMGSWRWIGSVGGIGGVEVHPPPTVRITYSPDGLFSYYQNDTLVETTTYTMVRQRTIVTPVSADIIHYGDSLRFVPQAFRISNDTLRLVDQVIDGYSQVYARMPE